MAKYKLLLPKMGESVEEATIIKWSKKPGDFIDADETVMEIATDKVDSDVPSPVSGKLVEQLYKDNDVVKVGAVIAIIETSGPEEVKAEPIAEQVTAAPVEEVKPFVATPVPPVQEAAPAPVAVEVAPQPEVKQPEEPKQQVYAEPVTIPYVEQLQQKPAEVQVDTNRNDARFYSPLVKNIAAQEGISNAELDAIPGTGAEGRLTKDDLLLYIQEKYQPKTTQQGTAPVQAEPERASEPVAAAPAEVPAPLPVAPSPEPAAQAPSPEPVAQAPQPEPPAAEPAETKAPKSVSMSGGDEIIEMDRMRRLIADHMVMSKHTSPHVTSFVEADVTNLVLWRERIKANFEKREGEKITFTPIFIEAVVRAIKDMPMINIQVNGTQIIKKKDINISMATALPSGNLIVPVIKRADELNLIGLTKAVNDLANRARTNKLKPDDVQGGTFTITNVGSFGNVMGTPIINQPQVAILAVGAIKKKPAVIETLQGDMIGIRHMMFLSLSYDHRVVDGALGGSFVRRVADYLENWETDREF
ncbi:dihydrolipoamide acetyltransferase family protein [Mucilaginibacter xinganensis]|uniref:Dihydrolipoamide acetyltransferase component of pyruvate dehydrogenase complex n=1 Tax=Mucilaginibacter xinganensis TaxID=1234841 RepID=A0A223NY32_9SPHI|nr:dihydrolipoamide acetyltransferase family protein [Mucilaginibacter xinganensis]ASU34614.1 diapophytoene dehydrogenase [Mucilaginibacter xinganensis]